MTEGAFQTKIIRPSFVDYFMAIATIASKRSHDMQTQHGGVITDDKNRILSIGYNGFARGMKDDELPNLRPKKYTWMLHAERNALANCMVRPDGGIAYVTGQCCLDCGMALWEHGIKKIYMIDGHGTVLYDDEMKANWNTFIEHTGIDVHKIKPDLDWAKSVFDKFCN
jgi:dCMP deaminase